MRTLIEIILGIVCSALVVGVVAAGIGIGSGLIDVDRLMGAPAAPAKPRIIATGPDTVTGFGFMERKKVWR
jgi:hypothetical protein